MAVVRVTSDTLECSYFQEPFTTFSRCSSWTDGDPAISDLSDAYCDSGSEHEENSQNVVRWLESLPADHLWCEVQEQVGCLESLAAASIPYTSGIGDPGFLVTPKLHRVSKKTIRGAGNNNINFKEHKHRRGSLNPHYLSTDRVKNSCNKEIGVLRKKHEMAAPNSEWNLAEFPTYLDAMKKRNMRSPNRNERAWDIPVRSDITI